MCDWCDCSMEPGPDGHVQSEASLEEDLEALGRDDELMRELPEMAYLFRRPLILDASDTEQVLGVSASSLDTMIDDSLRKD